MKYYCVVKENWAGVFSWDDQDEYNIYEFNLLTFKNPNNQKLRTDIMKKHFKQQIQKSDMLIEIKRIGE